jgi:hypothetical protein
MGTHALAVDTGRMDLILIYCRPRGNARAQTLRDWLEHQAAELSARPGVHRTDVVHLTTPETSTSPRRGWLLECELADAGGPPADTLRELLTDMRLIGLEPTVFKSQCQPACHPFADPGAHTFSRSAHR